MKNFIIAITVVMLCVAESLAHDVEIDGIYYNLYESDKVAEVTYKGYASNEYEEYSGSVTIPETITYNSQTYSVTSISPYAFEDCSGLTEVTIGNSVTSIGEDAFFGCNGLTKVNYLGSVDKWVEIDFKDGGASNPTIYAEDLYINNELLTDVKITTADSIKNKAFYNSKSIKSVEIGNSVTSIGEYAFYDCSGLTSVTIGNSVTSIGSSAFRGCSGLTSVTIPNSVTSIGSCAFDGCRGLTLVTIPNSVTSIGFTAFNGCNSLTKVNYLGSVDKWVEIDFEGFASNPTTYADDFYINNQLLTDVKITTADSIKDYAFYRCQSIKTVEIGNSVTFIGEDAFYNTGIYNSESNRDNGVLYVDNCLIKAKSDVVKGSYTIKEGTRVISGAAFEGCSGLTSVTIPNSVTSIGSSVFSDCSGLTSVTIPTSVTSIGSSAFNECSGLTSVTIPTSVTSIGSSAFSGCSGLTSVTIPTSVTSISSSAFYRCSGLTEITIPTSVTSIGSSAFSGCSGLTSVTIGESVTSIGGYAFSGCSGLTEVTIPNSVTSIGRYAFEDCSGLTSVIWNAKNCEDFSFFTYSPFYYICSSITSFTFGNEVEHIPAYLCYGMSKLTEITIPNSVTSIGEYAFSGCSGLTSVTIGESVTSIGGYAFSGCSGLTSVTIGNSVTSIGEDAFRGCSGLTSVIWNAKNCEDFSLFTYSPFYYICSSITSFTFGNEVEHIPAYLCYGMSKLTEITIPNSVTSIGEYAFYDCSGLTKVNYLGTVDKWVDIDFEDSRSNPTYNAKDLYINNELITDVKITTADSIKNYAFYNCQSIKSVEIGESVTSIGYGAFSGCDKLRKVTAYPTTVPNVYEFSFDHYIAALYVPCDVYYDYFLDDVFGKFKEIKCISAEEVEGSDKVEIEVDSNNNATIIWPSTGNASSYELVISKNGEVFCTLLFNENGQLTSIDFGNRSASVGFQFTVTGLDAASKYSYSIVAKDEKGNELESYNGTFTTNGYSEVTAILETLADANITVTDGTISADTDFTIYNTIGKDVTVQNGCLTSGVYVVKVGDDIAKVMVK